MNPCCNPDLSPSGSWHRSAQLVAVLAAALTSSLAAQWRADYFTLTNVHSGKALDVPYGALSPVDLVESALHSAPNQQFEFFPENAGDPLFPFVQLAGRGI